jgi:hypothetical protein
MTKRSLVFYALLWAVLFLVGWQIAVRLFA